MPPPPSDHAPPTVTPTVWQLFTGFLTLGLTGFGGVLPLARRLIVERRRWLSPPEFTELLGLCQFLPGGNIINLSVALGLRFHGVRGALAAITGLLAAPSLIVILLSAVYARFQDDPDVRHVFAGLAAAAAGLLIGLAVKLALPLRRHWLAAALAALCFAAIAVFRLPLLPVMLVMAPLSTVLLRWDAGRRGGGTGTGGNKGARA